ncbi:MAG: spore gernimation protein [Bacillales bacterium]|jgi:spore germination protein KB|nr:spore gernimation protein [Bacillales bacterium]
MKNEISPSQFKILLILYILGSAIIYMPTIQTVAAGRNGWISILSGGLIAVFILNFYVILSNTYPNNNLFELNMQILGKQFGRIINFSYLIYIVILLALITRGVGDFLATTILTETPIEVLMLLIILTVAIGANYGVVTLVRANQVLFPIVVLSFIIGTIFVLPLFDLTKFYPILDDGMKPILNGTLQIIGFPYTEVIILLSVFPFIKDRRKMKLNTLIATIITTIVFFIITSSGIGVLGADIVSRQAFSTYTIAKNFGTGNTILRLEAIFSIIWIITVFNELVICTIGLCKCISSLFNTNEYKVYVKPASLLLLPISLLIGKNIIFISTWTTKIWPIYSITMGLLLPICIYLIYKIKTYINNAVQDL